MKGFVLWLTGLPAAGKTTLARSVAEALRARGLTRLEVLDGDIIRTNLSQGLGFSKADRETNILRIGFVCRLLARNDVIVIVAAIAPYRELRERVRKEIGRYVEVYVKCPLEVLIQRDPKGLYRRALAGSLSEFTGVSAPYEEPVQPEITVETDRESVEASTKRIVESLHALGWLC